MMRKAGLRWCRRPRPSAPISALIRAQKEALSQVTEEYCVLDLGYARPSAYACSAATGTWPPALLEMGMATLDSVLADVYGVTCIWRTPT